MPTLILGLGNPLLRDDGVGLRVAQELQTLLHGNPELEVDLDYWGGLRLMERMVGFDRVIVIDAILSGAPAGTIHSLSPDDMPTRRSSSSHDMDLRTALQFGRHAGAKLPSDDSITLIAIEAVDVETFGETLTAKVEAAVPQAIELVLRTLGIKDNQSTAGV